MSTFAEMLTGLVTEFQDAIADAHPCAVRHWRGELIRAVRLMLDYDSESVLWAIEGCVPLEGLDSIEMTHGVEEDSEPSEEDREFAIALFEELALERDDYVVQEGDPPYEVAYDFIFDDELGIGPNEYDLDDRQFGFLEELVSSAAAPEPPPSDSPDISDMGSSPPHRTQREMF